MAIEAVYPYIAVAYGTFGIVFGVLLWWKTQRRIDRTKSAIETQVAAAVTDIKAQVTGTLGSFDLSGVAKQVEGLTANFAAFSDDIPDFDQEALLTRLDSLEQRLPDMIGTHISMAIKGVQATEGKAIAKYVEELGIEGITAEAQEAAVERLTTKQRLAYQLMTMKVPSKTKREHPVSSLVFEQSRGLVAQQLIESDARESGNVRIENGSGYSEGHRPGLRR
jgi:hypothetical protein